MTVVRYIQSTPSEHLDGRGPVVPVGNILGYEMPAQQKDLADVGSRGSSSINFMVSRCAVVVAETQMYNNASGSDFDDWQQPGWTFEELKPVIRKVSRNSRARTDSQD
jgi:alcohol oxidase